MWWALNVCKPGPCLWPCGSSQEALCLENMSLSTGSEQGNSCQPSVPFFRATMSYSFPLTSLFTKYQLYNSLLQSMVFLVSPFAGQSLNSAWTETLCTFLEANKPLGLCPKCPWMNLVAASDLILHCCCKIKGNHRWNPAALVWLNSRPRKVQEVSHGIVKHLQLSQPQILLILCKLKQHGHILTHGPIDVSCHRPL